MSYSVIATISESATLTRRIKACVAEQQIPNPSYWAEANALLLAASPGWATAWASADLTAPGDHGADEAVITDGMILSAVTALTASN